MNEDGPTLSGVKCRPMILVSRDIQYGRYIRIFAGFHWGGALNRPTIMYAYVQTFNMRFGYVGYCVFIGIRYVAACC